MKQFKQSKTAGNGTKQSKIMTQKHYATLENIQARLKVFMFDDTPQELIYSLFATLGVEIQKEYESTGDDDKKDCLRKMYNTIQNLKSEYIEKALY